MCDYSLMSVPNRLAKEDEELVSYRFTTGTIGFASCNELQQQCSMNKEHGRGLWAQVKAFFTMPDVKPVTAVCLPPGARLMVHGIPANLQRDFQVEADELATFTQLTAAPHAYRDALRFPNGKEVLLQRLTAGIKVEVLSLEIPAEQPVDQAGKEKKAARNVPSGLNVV